ncbi:serine/threonine-protein kinase [Shewanella sp. MF05960]|uniref:serine/threonine-protein kinase n=1 Tax=Shewanella sp. MF05960 TaxID=3434874 RepID=UPI003D7BC5CC
MSRYQVAEVTFEILEDIGQEGKNSDVYRILDSALNAEMVLKRINKANFSDAEQFFDEARKVYDNKHPNVVEVNYACQDNEFIYITMPYYQNGSLSGMMNQRFLTLREIIRYSVQFISGLHNIHSNNLLHFDLKPDNILLSDRNEAMLSDFGLAMHMDEYGFTTPKQLYSKHVPPEAINTREFSTSFDIYQAGLTMYRMCVGRDCFNSQFDSYSRGGAFDQGKFVQDLGNGTFPDRNLIPTHIHKKVKDAITKCLEVDPDNRFETALEIINAISDVDENYLDWEYEQDEHIRKWSKRSSSGVLHCLQIDTDRKSTAFKIGTTDKRTATANYSKDYLTDAELKRFLKQSI